MSQQRMRQPSNKQSQTANHVMVGKRHKLSITIVMILYSMNQNVTPAIIMDIKL
jgi:hypothetical protein